MIQLIVGGSILAVLGLISSFDVGQCETNIFVYKQKHFDKWGTNSVRRTKSATRDGFANWEASMISNLANDRLFGLTLVAIFVGILILNATSY